MQNNFDNQASLSQRDYNNDDFNNYLLPSPDLLVSQSADADTVSDHTISNKKLKFSADISISQKHFPAPHPSPSEIKPYTEAEFNKLPSSFRSHCQSKMTIVKDLIEKKVKKESQFSRIRQENNGYFDSFFIMPKNTTLLNYFAADSASALNFNNTLAEISAEYKHRVRITLADAMESDTKDISRQIENIFDQLEEDIHNLSSISEHYKPPVHRIMNYLKEEFFLLNFDGIIKTAKILSQDKYVNNNHATTNMANELDPLTSRISSLESKLDALLKMENFKPNKSKALVKNNFNPVEDSPKPFKERGRASSTSTSDTNRGISRGRAHSRDPVASNNSRSPSANRQPAKRDSSSISEPNRTADSITPTCYRCGKLGHKSSNCKYDHTKLHCEHCGTKGSHATRACRKNYSGPLARGGAK